MSNDNGLVDEYEKIQITKKELEIKEEGLRKEIIKLANEKNTDILFGIHKKCSIKEYTKVIYPENKTLLLEMIKEKGLYDKLSSINYFKLGPAILKREVDKDIIELTNREKAFRLSFKDI